MQAGWTWIRQRPQRQLMALLAGGLLVRGAIATVLPPGFDEAYYYLYTRHLDWSYFDHPLMVALTTGMGPWVTGQVTALTIRLGPLLLYTLALVLMYLTGTRLFSVAAGLLTVAIASLVPIFFLGFGVLTLPDSPLIFFWTLALYLAACEFFPTPTASPPLVPTYRPTGRLALIGLCVGLACLSKYHGVALGFGLVGFCLASPPHRLALRSPWLMAAVGLFLLAISPILIWNSQHDWISLRYQSGRAVPDRGYSLLELLGTFLVGVAYLFPSFGLPLWWVSLRSLWQRWPGEKADSPNRALQPQLVSTSSSFVSSPTAFLLWLALPLMLGFTLMGGYRPILPTWAMPGFWGATLLLGAAAAGWQQQFPRRVRRWLWGSGWVIMTLILIALLHVTVGLFQQPGRYSLFGGGIPVRSDASTQLIEIQQLRQGWAESDVLQAALQQTDFVFTNELFLAGQVGMALAPLTDKPVTTLDEDLRGFAFWFQADQWLGRDGLYVASQRRSPLPAQKYGSYFDWIEKIADIPLKRGGEVVDVIQVYRAHTLLKPFPRPYGLS